MRQVAFLVGAVCVLNVTSSHAQPARVFVSGTGSDSNACTFLAPCRTFEHAHDSVAAGGEIDVLDPAGYGSVVVTKSISIQGHGFAGISQPSGTAITINAGPNDKINLRGLLIDGLGSGNYGINFIAGGALNVQETLIRGFRGTVPLDNFGLIFTSISTTTASLFVTDTVISDNTYGLYLFTLESGAITAVIDGVHIEGNENNGLTAEGSNGTGVLNVTFANSVSSGNAQGIVAESAASHSAVNVQVRNTKIANNLHQGIFADNGLTTVRVAQTSVNGNETGLQANNGSAILSYRDNNVDGNTTDGAFTSTILNK